MLVGLGLVAEAAPATPPLLADGLEEEAVDSGRLELWLEALPWSGEQGGLAQFCEDPLCELGVLLCGVALCEPAGLAAPFGGESLAAPASPVTEPLLD